MYFLLFNSFGEDFDSVTFSKNISHPRLKIFKKGDRMHSPKMFHKEAGISILLEEVMNSDQAISEIRKFIKNNEPWLKQLLHQPVKSKFNIGITVGGDNFSPCIDLDTDFLSLVNSLEIGININCYPSSD